MAEKLAPLSVTSPAFDQKCSIPSKYTCDGEDINPPLRIEGIPGTAKSLALIVDDPDAPGKTFVHWVMWNIPVQEKIAENSSPGEQGMTDFGRRGYGGPCPPSGEHRYYFKVCALDRRLSLPANTTKLQLQEAMRDCVIAAGELMGVYRRGME